MSLKVTNLKKSFAQGESRIEVLKGLNLEVATGKIVAILGQSGAGKSTFLGLLSGLDVPDSGSVEIGGQNVSALSPEARTLFRGKQIGIVFQQFHLVPHLTALENVALPLEIQGETDVESRARAMLESLGLGHRLHHHPGTMSGGECQRVAIARALVGRPSLILADEPSGNLDLETGEKVTQVFFDQIRKAGITTILVTHNPELARLCDERYSLRGGLCVPS
ncbi:MAG: ABC transporter ATP-binding protein [Bdellovibrionaceae bacterium]|nr:ABC transporter ATP-binding protein [Pseudobdellovibrionaceae bacterium]